MKEFLVDVPVQINIWVRPECQKKQLEVLQKARPSIILIVSDGGRNENEWAIIRQNRHLVESGIDWNCTVYKLYEERNMGVKKMIMKTHEFVWERVDKCIFLEDDIVPSVSFFQYCKELLDKYENDLRISVICGMNHLGTYNEVSSDYFFSRQGSIWGYALWKRTYSIFYEYGYENDSYIWNRIKESTKKDRTMWSSICKLKKNKNIWLSPMEYFMEFSIYSQHQLMIIPKKNMICCMGATKSAHGADSLYRMPKAIRQMFFMKTYEISFPLKHPQFIIPDEAYEKKRNLIVGRNHPGLAIIRKIQRGLYVLKDGDIKYLWNKIRR